ncbi:sterol desaturase family protein [Conexibacter sp. W3-3-2]|uniref:sterol desaturase family protein n=1 Tax=Conexibacter sp. W3-3-2 TaxID=2675227 RepID=UPI001327959E|nr:sterol desaturase family protein [Conexibacter sp. W3-3-2]MTD44763.1 sterol desaturase family protein [Conexibacter sp. W3-3-2]
MSELITYAIPFFVLLLALEALSYHLLGHDHHDDEPATPLRGYERRDTVTSLTMGLGNVAINVGWKLVVVALYVTLYELTPIRMPQDAWWAFVLLFVADDLAFYWYHRVGHRVRIGWASHVVHHSSEHYNLSTALRQPWVPMTALPFWLPLALLGFAPWMILMQQAISLIYQFGLHTERIGRLPRPVEWVFNTPSHHRVHHGANARYLDKNYGGILIVWDRLFGTFEPEGERVRYGLTTNIGTFNPVQVATHEWKAIWADMQRADRLADKLRYTVKPPGWRHDEQPGTAAAATAPEPPVTAAAGR